MKKPINRKLRNKYLHTVLLLSDVKIIIALRTTDVSVTLHFSLLSTVRQSD